MFFVGCWICLELSRFKIGSQNIADFVEKYIFEEYLTWIVFGFKLDLFRNNMRFDFILKDCF
jgi:hypothetical protein